MGSRHILGLAPLVVFFALVQSPSSLAHEDGPHPFAPELRPIAGTPEDVPLTEEEQQRLYSGKIVIKRFDTPRAGSGIVFREVNAPPAAVWKIILSFEMYPKWSDNISQCDVVRRQGRIWYVEMLTRFLWVTSKLNFIHRIQRPMGYVTWTLDRSKKSDIRDLVGYWRVSESSQGPNFTRLEYGSQVITHNVPDFVVDFLARDTLIEGTEWVKEQAELAYKRDQENEHRR